MKVLLIHHAGSQQAVEQHAIQIFHVAKGLAELGVDAVLAVGTESVDSGELGTSKVKFVDFTQARSGDFGFAEGGGPDLVHAWTPREHVRELTNEVCERFGCPYIVHLEDNEQAVTEDELFDHRRRGWEGIDDAMIDVLIVPYRSHPVRARQFLERAAGATLLIDKLAEHLPSRLPHITFWPGFEPMFAEPPPRPAARAAFGLADDELSLVYTGNIHWSNLPEIRSLALAIALLARSGIRVKLLRTGFNHAPAPWEAIPELKSLVIELGFLPRTRMPELLAAADVLVQPGEANRFNNYRFPSKLAEFLASGRPVILPRANLGRFLKDGENALLLETGRATELAQKIRLLADHRELRCRLGKAGSEFAMQNLCWEKNVPAIRNFYDEILAQRKLSPQSPAGSAIERHAPSIPAKLIAFYLPQFHRIAENDRWWGQGFTEWTNVKRAQPNFSGHAQPNLPTELGFYDLRDAEVMTRQAKMARRHGIFGFCYYYYWFNGKRLLQDPVDRMLASGEPDFPFCLCWANENWTRRWDGQESEVLMRQEYSPDADERFIRDILPFLKDKRYIRVEGKHLLLVYRVDQLPNAKITAECWRRVAKEEGVELHLSMVQSFGAASDPREYGFDAAVEFPPHRPHKTIEGRDWASLDPNFKGYLEDYRDIVQDCIARGPVDYPWYRGVMPAWDNTPRRQREAHIYVNSSPEIYEAWLRHAVTQALAQPGQAPMVFLNSWNEWAEGAHLEPDEQNGMRRLEATLHGLAGGIADRGRQQGIKADENLIAANVARQGESRVSCSSDVAVPPAACLAPGRTVLRPPAATHRWFDGAELRVAAKRYIGQFKVAPLSYATVGDYCDSYDHLRPLALSNFDLKAVQRCWILKTILGQVPPGGRLLEIGAGQPLVADLLYRLGYDVLVVDPYDGSGNGPREFELFRGQYPNLDFARDIFSDRLKISPASFDCIYSISVLEHVPVGLLPGIFAGLRKFLKPGGLNLHAIDHVHRGNGAERHLDSLNRLVDGFGLGVENLKRLLVDQLPSDPEAYYLSAESHNIWRGNLKYSEFPMRMCISVQTFGTAEMIRAPDR